MFSWLKNTERNTFVTSLLFFVLGLLLFRLWEQRFWVRITRHLNARLAGVDRNATVH